MLVIITDLYQIVMNKLMSGGDRIVYFWLNWTFKRQMFP